ncbi:ABC transporter substrate-binding protein [Flavisphingomonas formosensis]|uniref:ABC transporter substrate-binding protein n=1 Tax=Flavisphingomonas formosensis TaxID=861534 RepID=UPI0012F72B75|nr:ABC transporter substrate-binding protein [Sphingomonas formosensis]
MRFALLLTALAVLVTGCSRKAADGPITVSAIGEAPDLVDPSRKTPNPASAILLSATAQGLVAFDAAGEVKPALGERWIIFDDGLDYTFRIAAGSGIGAEQAARLLRRMINPRSNNGLRPVLGAIEEIVAVTPEVVEIRLRSPRPNLLQLLAQPDMALIFDGKGTGPMRILSRDAGSALLRPLLDEDADDPATRAIRRGERDVRLIGEAANNAVRRFVTGRSALVLGGSFTDLQTARNANPPADALRFDPVIGLFGLQFVEKQGFLAAPENRRALSMALDRDRIVSAFAVKGWRASTTLVPAGIADLPAPTAPDWAGASIGDRRTAAAHDIAMWTKQQGAAPTLRIALPAGPGAMQLFRMIRDDWAAIGVHVAYVAMDADADLRLIDAVAPADVGSWYLRRFTCKLSAVCSETADQSLDGARLVATLAERSALLVDAEKRLSDAVPFIPIAMPLRWALVSPALDGFRTNARGVHPLDELRTPRR